MTPPLKDTDAPEPRTREHCPKSEHGHCECWYDGHDPCCHCGDNSEPRDCGYDAANCEGRS